MVLESDSAGAAAGKGVAGAAAGKGVAGAAAGRGVDSTGAVPGAGVAAYVGWASTTIPPKEGDRIAEVAWHGRGSQQGQHLGAVGRA